MPVIEDVSRVALDVDEVQEGSGDIRNYLEDPSKPKRLPPVVGGEGKVVLLSEDAAAQVRRTFGMNADMLLSTHRSSTRSPGAVPVAVV